jgi:hypothetical protein
MWTRAFSRAAPAIHIRELAATAATTATTATTTSATTSDATVPGASNGESGRPALLFFGRALFSPPGYSSLLFAQLHDRIGSCPYRLDVLTGFVRHFLSSYGLKHELDPTAAATAVTTTTTSAHPPAISPLTIRVSLIVRRPYDAGARERLDRQFADETALISTLQSLSGLSEVNGATLIVDVVDFATYSTLESQLAQTAKTDVMIGVHGAGLAHVLWLPEHAGLLEIRAQCMFVIAHRTSHRIWIVSVLSVLSSLLSIRFWYVAV